VCRQIGFLAIGTESRPALAKQDLLRFIEFTGMKGLCAPQMIIYPAGRRTISWKTWKAAGSEKLPAIQRPRREARAHRMAVFAISTLQEINCVPAGETGDTDPGRHRNSLVTVRKHQI